LQLLYLSAGSGVTPMMSMTRAARDMVGNLDIVFVHQSDRAVCHQESPPSSCSQGVCGTCKTVLLQGTVEMNHNGGIRQREIDKGLRLLCCSKPTSDLVLDL
jgi:ferredoxin